MTTYLGSFNAAQLSSMIVTPAINGTAPAPRECPILGSSVEPKQELLVVFLLKHIVALVHESLRFGEVTETGESSA